MSSKTRRKRRQEDEKKASGDNKKGTNKSIYISNYQSLCHLLVLDFGYLRQEDEKKASGDNKKGTNKPIYISTYQSLCHLCMKTIDIYTLGENHPARSWLGRSLSLVRRHCRWCLGVDRSMLYLFTY
jgi:hypothetical protein